VAFEQVDDMTNAELVLSFQGDLRREDARAVYDTVGAASAKGVRVVGIDLGSVRSIDSVAAAALSEGIDVLERQSQCVVLREETELATQKTGSGVSRLRGVRLRGLRLGLQPFQHGTASHRPPARSRRCSGAATARRQPCRRTE
jgi:anti-anti-sigma regulatory factor